MGWKSFTFSSGSHGFSLETMRDPSSLSWITSADLGPCLVPVRAQNIHRHNTGSALIKALRMTWKFIIWSVLAENTSTTIPGTGTNQTALNRDLYGCSRLLRSGVYTSREAEISARFSVCGLSVRLPPLWATQERGVDVPASLQPVTSLSLWLSLE